MTTPINSTLSVGCMYNGHSETSVADVIEHIGNFRCGDAIRDRIDPRSPSEVNFKDRTVNKVMDQQRNRIHKYYLESKKAKK